MWWGEIRHINMENVIIIWYDGLGLQHWEGADCEDGEQGVSLHSRVDESRDDAGVRRREKREGSVLGVEAGFAVGVEGEQEGVLVEAVVVADDRKERGMLIGMVGTGIGIDLRDRVNKWAKRIEVSLGMLPCIKRDELIDLVGEMREFTSEDRYSVLFYDHALVEPCPECKDDHGQHGRRYQWLGRWYFMCRNCGVGIPEPVLMDDWGGYVEGVFVG